MYIDVGIEASACAHSADTIRYDTCIGRADAYRQLGLGFLTDIRCISSATRITFGHTVKFLIGTLPFVHNLLYTGTICRFMKVFKIEN